MKRRLWIFAGGWFVAAGWFLVALALGLLVFVAAIQADTGRGAPATGTRINAQITAPSPSEGAVPLPQVLSQVATVAPATATILPTPTSTGTLTASPSRTATPSATPSPTPITAARIAVIGDYGMGNTPEADVAALVKSWNPDIVITVGDNNYAFGGADTIDEHIGRDYHEFIFPYLGSFGQGAQTNRFFPSIGNHDFNILVGYQPYLDYFNLPGNERYYDFTFGPAHLFAVNSDSYEPDGFNLSSAQADWLEAQLKASTSPWDIVYFHHAPYSSGAYHGSTTWMRWKFAEWGADAVLAGHDHTYERLFENGIPYFVNGLGGGSIYSFGDPIPGSQVRYNADYGAMLILASPTEIAFTFVNRHGETIDTYMMYKPYPG